MSMNRIINTYISVGATKEQTLEIEVFYGLHDPLKVKDFIERINEAEKEKERIEKLAEVLANG